GSRAVFWLAAQWNIRDELSRYGIDDRRRVRVAIEREHAIRRRVKNDRVRIFGSRNPSQRLEGLEIEHDHGLIIARSRESVTARGGDRGSVSALDPSHLTEQFPGVFVHNHHAVLPGYKYAMIRGIRKHIIP